MSKMSELIFEIQDEIDRGDFSFSQIAIKNGVSLDFVNDVWQEMCENMNHEHHDEFVECDSWYEDQYDLQEF